MTRAGFTLLELTVSLALAAAVVAIGHGAVGFVVDRQEASARTYEEAAAAGGAGRPLARWLEGALVLPAGEGLPFQGVDRATERGADDELRFLTVTAAVGGARYAEVHVYIDRDTTSASEGLVAELRAWPDGPSRTLELEPTVTAFDAVFLTGGSAPVEVHGWNSSAQTPQAVRLHFGGDSIAALYRAPMTVPIGLPS